MTKLRRFTWADEVYDVTIFLLHGDPANALAWTDKTFGDITKQGSGEWTGAKTFWIERPKAGCALVLWFPAWWHVDDGMYLSVLAHECFHAAEFVLRERGMTLTDSSDEVYAYYIAWMFRNVYKRLAPFSKKR